MNESPSNMQMPCLDLCEMTPSWNNPAEAKRRINLLAARFDEFADRVPRRVYIGSSFCPQLLFAVTRDHMRALAQACAQVGCSITLVLPIATEHNLDRQRAHAHTLLDAADGAIDEVTANDYGELAYWSEQIAGGLPVRLNVGRLLNKDTRDARDEAFNAMTHTPRALERGWQGWGNVERLVQTWPISCIEFDPMHKELDLSDLPCGLTAAVHGPLCYQSTGQICEFASIDVPATEKFRPNAPCKLQCQSTCVRHTGASGVEYLKLGRSLYFSQSACAVRSEHPYRLLLSPLEEVLG